MLTTSRRLRLVLAASLATAAAAARAEGDAQDRALSQLTLELSLARHDRKLDHDAWRTDALAACGKEPDASACMATKSAARAKELATMRDEVLADVAKRRDAAREPVDAATAAAALAKLAGVYKERFQDGLVDGSKYQGENILEIVPVEGDAAYFKIHVDAFNGHVCNIFGVARYGKSGTLVFENEGEGLGSVCLMQIAPKGDAVTLVDDATYPCRETHCGARGMLDGVAFKTKHRRDIRYLQRLKDSTDYKTSIEAFHGAKPAGG